MSYKKIDDKREYQKLWIKNRREEGFKKLGPCVKCGSTENLELDHIDPSTKVSHKIWSWSEVKRQEELSKCQVLCKTHHREKTNEENYERLKGKPNLRARTISDAMYTEVIKLVKSGLSERKACALVGISRGTYSTVKLGGYRKDIFGEGTE